MCPTPISASTLYFSPSLLQPPLPRSFFLYASLSSLPTSLSLSLLLSFPPYHRTPSSLPQTVDVNFDKDTVLKCGNSSAPADNHSPSLGWALNERASENVPGFRLRQHVRCFLGNSPGEGARNGECETCCDLPLLVQTIQYSMDIGL